MDVAVVKTKVQGKTCTLSSGVVQTGMMVVKTNKTQEWFVKCPTE